MKISNIQEIIDSIPAVISYIAYGYIFVSIFYWSSFKDNKDFNNMLIKSIAMSYLLRNFYTLCESTFNYSFAHTYTKIVAYCFVSGLLALIIGNVLTNRWANFILHCLGTNRTINDNIWFDVVKSGTWLTIFMEDGTSYLGQCKYLQPFTEEPIVVLISYQLLDSQNNIILDYSNEPQCSIMLNTKNFQRIEIEYSKTIEQEWEDIKSSSLIVRTYRKIKRHSTK